MVKVKAAIALGALLTMPAVMRAGPFEDYEALSPAVHARMGEMYKRALTTFLGQDKTEFSFQVLASGQPTAIESEHTYMRNKVTLQLDDVAMVHTHPGAADRHPSDNDCQVANQTHIPDYVLSRSELWLAAPDGRAYFVGYVEFKHGQFTVSK